MTPAASWSERDYYRAVRNARAAFDRANPQLSFGVLESAGTWEAAPAVSSAPSDGNPRGHPPDDQRFPALSPSGRGRDSGALDSPNHNGPGRNTPKVSRGQGQGGESK